MDYVASHNEWLFRGEGKVVADEETNHDQIRFKAKRVGTQCVEIVGGLGRPDPEVQYLDGSPGTLKIGFKQRQHVCVIADLAVAKRVPQRCNSE